MTPAPRPECERLRKIVDKPRPMAIFWETACLKARRRTEAYRRSLRLAKEQRRKRANYCEDGRCSLANPYFELRSLCASTLEVLRAVEWCQGVCPMCRGRRWTHAPDCALNAEIKRLEAVGGSSLYV